MKTNRVTVKARRCAKAIGSSGAIDFSNSANKIDVTASGPTDICRLSPKQA